MRLFIVDDNQVSVFLTRHTLALQGIHDIETFNSAQEALAFLTTCAEEALPDVLLLDLNMSVMNGWELLDALADLAPRLQERCRVYILTASLSLTDTDKASRYSIVAGLLHKPITRGDVQFMGYQRLSLGA